MLLYYYWGGRDGAVAVATCCWLNGPVFEYEQEQETLSSPYPFRKALTPVHPLSQ